MQARYVGPGDQHDERYTSTEAVVPFYTNPLTVDDWDTTECQYDFVFYASETFEDSYRADLPIIITVRVVSQQ